MPRTLLKVFGGWWVVVVGGGWWFESEFSVHLWSKALAYERKFERNFLLLLKTTLHFSIVKLQSSKDFGHFSFGHKNWTKI